MLITNFVATLLLTATSALAQGITLAGHTRDVLAVACSADGKLLVSGGEDGSVLIWDAAAKQQSASYKSDASMAVAVSPDGKRVASGERYNKVRLMDSGAKDVKTLDGHDAGIIAVAFSPDNKTLMSFAKNGGLRLWDATTGVAQGAPQRVPDSFDSGAFSPDGKWFAGGTTQFVYLYSVTQKKLAWKTVVGSMVKGVAISPDSRSVAIAVGDDSVRLLDAATGKEKGKIAALDANGVAFSPDNTKIAAAGHDNDVHIIDAAAMKVTSVIKGHDRTVRSVCFMPDGKSVASASFDMTVRVWPVP